MVTFRRSLLILICTLSCSSCSYLADGCDYVVSCVSYIDYFFPPDTAVTFEIKTSAACNDLTPVYFLIKATDFSHFLMVDYQQIATEVAHPEEEPTYLASLCLLPGTTKTIKLEVPEDKAIAFYALFTQPENGWKHLINTEECFTKVEVLLGQHEIESVKIE